jgi:hypothetical protein
MRDVSSVTDGRMMQFFNVARVQYPDAILTPAAVTNQMVALTNASPAGTFLLEFSLGATGSGTYLLTPEGGSPLGPHPVHDHVWNQEAYRGQFVPSISGIQAGGWPVTQANVSLVFESADAGVFAGRLILLNGDSVPLGGTFAVSDL